jgi:hypothetical protein
MPHLEHPLPVARHKDWYTNDSPSPVDSIAFQH